jgi:hypothetical protein
VRHKVVELPLIPGALSDDTDLAAKLHAISMDKVRSRGNRWETIKGWSAFNASGMSAGTARGIHTYSDLDGNPIVVAASESAVNAWIGGTRLTITPKWVDVWISPTADYPDPTGVAGEIIIRWDVYTPATDTSTEADHHLAVGDVVTITNVVQDSGDSLQLEGTHTITAVTPTTFTIDVGSGTTINLERPFLVTAAFRSGLVTGTGDTSATRTRAYAIDNFGENAVFCGSDGTPVFAWEPATSWPELVTDGGFALSGASAEWELGSAWSLSSAVATHTTATEGDLEQDISQVLEGGKTYEISFAVTTYQAHITIFRVRIDSVDIFPPQLGTITSGGLADMVRTWTFRFVCPANPQLLRFTAKASDSTTDDVVIDNVSVKQLSIARPIGEAPQKNYGLFVDGNRILNTLGTVGASGDFDPTLLRWSDQDNYREWVPDTDNVSGEYPLGKGSRAVCGAQVGSTNLILTDAGAFTANFTGTSAGYAVRPIGQGCGAVATRALAVYNGRAFWASPNALYAFDGAQVLPIECPIKDQYVAKLSQYQENKTFAWMNTEYGEVWVHYPHTSDSGETSRYLLFNTVEEGNPWSFGTFDRVCMASPTVFSNPIGIDASDNIWRHETGTTFSGSGIVLPFIETGYVTGEAGDRWMGCRRYYPDIENQTGNILFTVTGKRAPQGQNNTQIIGPLILIPDQRAVDFLLSCRQLKFKWASYSSTTFWRLGIVGLEMRAQKERR